MPDIGGSPWRDQGGAIPKWEGRKRGDALALIRKHGARNNLPCVICRQPIDYTLKYPDPNSCSVQHIVPRSVRPELTWEPSNWAPAHLTCNKVEGVNMTLTLGQSSARFQ